MNLEFLNQIEWNLTTADILDGLLAASLRGGIVALLGGLLVLAWHKRAAADRHRVWTLVLLSFGAIPLLGFFGPTWNWSVAGPVAERASVWPAEPVAERASVWPSEPVAERTSVWPAEPVAERTSVWPSSEPVAERASVWPSEPVAERASVWPSEPVAERTSVWPFAQLWLLGMAIVWLRVLVGWLGLTRLRRHTADQQSSKTRALQSRANALAPTLGITRPVEVFVSARRVMPMTWGFWRPKLLLPVEALSWQEDRVDTVLLHELAHVRRHDSLGQVLAQVLLGIYWFHPAMWLATWRLAVERERACDDMVLKRGVKASDYAAHLMSVSTGRELLQGQQVCAIAMASPAQLEARLRRVLDSAVCRRGMGPGGYVALIVLTVLVLAPVSIINVTAQNSEEIPGVLEEIEATNPNQDEALFETEESPVAEDGANVEKLLLEVVLPDNPNSLPNLPDDEQAAVDAVARASLNRNSETRYLKTRLAAALNELAKLEKNYLDRHPKVIEQRALVTQLRAQIDATMAIVRVATPQPGIVRKVSVKSGDTVEAGDVLVTLDQRRAKLAVNSAQNGLALAKLSLDQADRSMQMAKNQVERGAISPADLGGAELQAHEARSRLSTAETDLESAMFDLEDLTIRAPASGKVLAIDVRVGEYATPENPVVRLQATLEPAP